LGTIAFEAPPALAQIFAGVLPCEEPQTSQGKCPVASEVGTVAATAGLGSYPIALGGPIYLTGPYGSSSQGLSIVLPISPGPLELGTVIVRAGIEVNPSTGRLILTSGQLPRIVDGVPLHLDELLLQLDRGEFRIEGDSCESLAVTGTITSAQNSSVQISTDPLGAPLSSCPPPEEPPFEEAPKVSVVLPGTATVALLTTHITTSGLSLATAKLVCRGSATCQGKLTLTSKTKARDKSRDGKGRFKMTIIGNSRLLDQGRHDRQGRAQAQRTRQVTGARRSWTTGRHAYDREVLPKLCTDTQRGRPTRSTESRSPGARNAIATSFIQVNAC
jgi:hypothetical protein